MATIVTFVILAGAGAVLWWLLRDAFFAGQAHGGPKCPVCGGRAAPGAGPRRRCASCGAHFKAHAAWHLHEPTLPIVSVLLLAFAALLVLALFDMLLGWRIFGAARAALVALAAGGGIAAAVCSFVKHRRQYGRN